jgi:BMFP domain-containing protein YqiC
MEAYEETLGHIIQIPSVGPSREKYDLVFKCIDAAARSQGAYLEFALEMQIPAREAFEKVAGKLASLIGPESTAEDFHKFYEELSKETEQRLFELFKSQRFATAMKITLSTSLDLFKLSQELMEQQLKGTPVVTRSEMDEVEQEIVATRRKVEKQAAEIAALKSALSKKGSK